MLSKLRDRVNGESFREVNRRRVAAEAFAKTFTVYPVLARIEFGIHGVYFSWKLTPPDLT
ncbi:MAG: hypothetical protein GY896_17660 [Gammaproteobacteria bacterium]|nr:hypothetical protein [Gammaproteobacteria bacterium]